MANDRNFAVNMIIGARDRTSRVLGGINKRLGFLRSRVTQVAAAFGAFLGGRAIVRGLQSVIGEAATLESAMAGVQAATGAADEEIAQLREEAVRLGRETQYTADQAAGAMENLGRAGLTTQENLQTIPKVLDLAVASGMNLAEAASVVTGTVRGMGMEFGETGRVVDVLTAASQSANTTVKGLGQAMSQAAPLARNLGLTVEETSAFIGTLANNNIDASRAGTALRKIFVDLDNPTSTFSQALSEAGIESRNLFEVLQQLQEGGPKVEAAINGIGNEAIASLRVLVREADGDLASLVEQMDNAEGSANQAAGTIRDTLNNALQRLGSAWNTVKRAVGEPVLDTVREQVRRLDENLTSLVESGRLEAIGESIAGAFRKGERAVRDFLDRFTLEEAFNKARSMIDGLGTAFQKMGDAFTAVSSTVKAAFYGIQAVASPVVSAVLYGISQVLNAAANASQGLERMGLVAEGTTEAMRTRVEALRSASVETMKYTATAAKNAMEEGSKATAAMGRLASEQDEAAKAAQSHADAQDEAAKSTDRARSASQDLADEYARQANSSSTVEQLNDKLGRSFDAISKTTQSVTAALKGKTRATEEDNQETREFVRQTGQAEDAAEELAESMETLGVETQASLEQAAESARQAFETVRQNGSTEEIQRAFEAYAQKAIKANDGVVSSSLQTRAELLGLEEVLRGLGQTGQQAGDQAASGVDKVGDAARKAAQETAEAAERTATETQNSARGAAAALAGLVNRARQHFTDISDAAGEAFKRVAEQAANGIKPVRVYLDDLARGKERLQLRIDQERESLENLKQVIRESGDSTRDLTRIANMSVDQFELLGKQDLKPVRRAIQQAQDQLDRMRSSADSTLDSLQEELLRLEGREQELMRRRHQNRREELEAQLEAAEAAGDDESVSKLREALRTLDKIAETEQKRIEQREAEERQRQERQEAEEQQRQNQERTDKQQSSGGGAPVSDTGEPSKRIELRGPDGETATVHATDGEANKLVEQLQKAGMRTT